jgi:serine/threonine-protein kinase/endoribonuclease IRE1
MNGGDYFYGDFTFLIWSYINSLIYMCRFFALERYDASLEQFCKGIYKGPMPSDAQVICQITKGLLYLHTCKFAHANLTPRTILIASSQPVRMMIKLSEFGLSKLSDQCDEELGEKQEDLCQRKYWRLDGTTTNSNEQTPTPNQDTFAAGCLCFYFLKRGVHPFGDDSSSILEKIKKRNPVNLLKSNSFVYNINENK